MQRPLRLLKLLPLLLLVGWTSANANSNANASADDDALHQRLARHLDHMAADGFSGVVLVARGDRVVLHEGYGSADRDRDLAMPRDAVFTIGSIAKPFTATLVLQLAEQGKLKVEDPLHRHLPDVPADKRGITLHHLLTHSSGWPGAIGHDFDFIERDAWVRQAMAEPLLFEPGERYEYSNVGYSLLAAVIERVTERPYADVLRSLILDPVGMHDTGFAAERWPRDRLAQGYRAGERWGTVTERFGDRGPSWHLLGNGGLHSTASDIWRFHRALLGDTLLSSASKDLAFTRHVPEDPSGSSHYGYGWALFETARGGRLVAHNGGNPVFFADFQRYLDDELTIFLAANQKVRGLFSLGETLARIALDPDFEPPSSEPAESIRVDASPANGETDGDALAAAWTLQDHHQGRAVARFLEALVRDEARRELLDGLFAQRLIDKVGHDALIGMVGELAADFGDFELDNAVRRGADRVELEIDPADKPMRFLLVLSFDAEAPHGIVGIGVDGIE